MTGKRGGDRRVSDRVIISLKNAITLAYNATFHRHKKFVGDNHSDSYYFF